MLPEQKRPTHVLTITVPLNFDANPAAEDYDIQGAFQEAVTTVVQMSRLGTLGLICDQIQVELLERPEGGS